MRQLHCQRAHLTAPEVWDGGKGRYKEGALQAAAQEEGSVRQALEKP